MQDSNLTQVTSDIQENNKQTERKQYVKPEMTEQKPLDRATTTVYYFYE